MRRNAAPIIAAILLLLPALYLGSYLALVKPGGSEYRSEVWDLQGNVTVKTWNEHYPFGGVWGGWFFWPLEQIDRKLRPGAWGQLQIGR